MNILVTGSNGFVGSALMWRLQRENHKVIGIDISTHCDDVPHPDTRLGDIRKPEDLDGVFSAFSQKYKLEIDTVIHCAAAKHDFGVSEQEYYSHNETGTRILIERMTAHNINNLIYFSSVSVFGHPDQRTDEDGKFAPDNPYGASKLAGELIAVQWQKTDPQRKLAVLRPAAIFGPHNYANMYKLIDMMHRHPYVTIGDSDYIKGIVSLANMIDMTMFTLGRLQAGIIYFNCVDKPYLTVRQLMEIIASDPQFRIPTIRISSTLAIFIGRIFDVPARLLKIDFPVSSHRMEKLSALTDFASERIREAGYVQQNTLEGQIKATTDWYLSLKQCKKKAL